MQKLRLADSEFPVLWQHRDEGRKDRSCPNQHGVSHPSPRAAPGARVSYLGKRTPTANTVTPLSCSCLAGSATCPWDLPSVMMTRTWGTEAFLPPGNPLRRKYFRARPVSVCPPLSSAGRKKQNVNQ